MHLTLSNKLTLSVLIGLLAVLSVLGYLGLQAVRESTDRTLQERLVLANALAQEIDQEISERLQLLRDACAEIAPDMAGNQPQPVADALARLYEREGPYTKSVFVWDGDTDTMLMVPADEPAHTPTAYYPNVLRSINGEPAVSGAIVSSIGDEFLVSLSIPVPGETGDTLGVLGTTIGPASDYFKSLLAPVHLGETGYAQVINERGLVIAASDAAADSAAFPVTAHADHFSDLIEEGEGGVWTCHRCHEPDGEGDRRQDIMAFAPLTTTPWGVAIRQDKDEAFGPRSDLEKKLLIFGSAALGLSLAAALVVGRILSGPLRQLTLASQRIATGDLREPVNVNGRDEIGQLGAAFETMRRKLNRSREELEERSRSLATLEERNRIAREMHDSLSQVLSYIRLTTNVIEERIADGDLGAAREKLMETRQAARDAYEDVRQGILALRAGGALEKGFLPTLEEFLDHFREQTELTVELHVPDPEGVALTEAAQVQLLRIIQEALANVRKHARAKRVTIEFGRSEGSLAVWVVDDGQGFDPDQAAREGGHFGLQTMRERAVSVGGALEVLSQPGAGTRILVRIPPAEARSE